MKTLQSCFVVVLCGSFCLVGWFCLVFWFFVCLGLLWGFFLCLFCFSPSGWGFSACQHAKLQQKAAVKYEKMGFKTILSDKKTSG